MTTTNDNTPVNLPAAKAAVARLALHPKAENMDGDDFDQWLAKMSAALPPDYRGSWGERPDQVTMFNCNYDPTVAALRIVKQQLGEEAYDRLCALRLGTNPVVTRPLRIRRCTGNRAAWLLVALRDDGSESDSYGSFTTSYSLDSLLERGRHLVAKGSVIELVVGS